MKHFIFFFFFLLQLTLVAQPHLKPPINGEQAPTDTARVRELIVSNFDESYEEAGLKENDTVPQFVLYDVKGNKFDLHKELAKGKPVFMLFASYTCNLYRNCISNYDELVKRFKNKINFVIVYGIEAHPRFPEACPYTNDYWAVEENIKQNISYGQPKNYGERKKMAEIMIKAIKPLTPVYIDGPKNEWLQTFGPAPNIAYLIHPNGTVYSKYTYFIKSQGEVVKNIISLVGLP